MLGMLATTAQFVRFCFQRVRIYGHLVCACCRFLCFQYLHLGFGRDVSGPVWTRKLREDYFQNVRGTYCEDNIRMGASMYYGEDQWAIGGINERGTWDTNLEEIWHIISRGWYNVYLEEFGNHENVNRSSKLRDAMDLARGGKFEFVPESYPENAWYTYYDQSCIYQCQASEYLGGLVDWRILTSALPPIPDLPGI